MNWSTTKLNYSNASANSSFKFMGKCILQSPRFCTRTNGHQDKLLMKLRRIGKICTRYSSTNTEHGAKTFFSWEKHNSWVFIKYCLAHSTSLVLIFEKSITLLNDVNCRCFKVDYFEGLHILLFFTSSRSYKTIQMLF